MLGKNGKNVSKEENPEEEHLREQYVLGVFEKRKLSGGGAVYETSLMEGPYRFCVAWLGLVCFQKSVEKESEV